MQKKCVVLCGGGTGGHIYPNLALARELSPHRRVCYIGNEGGMEEKLCREVGVEFFPIHAPKFRRSFTLENAKLPFVMNGAVKEAKGLLEKLSPAVIFSKGGYVSLPVCLAGVSLKIPVLCHESDLTVGLANKISYMRGGILLSAFKPTMEGKKRVIHVGAPLRKEIFQKSPNFPKRNNGLLNLLVIGGSQGAKAINEGVISSLPNLATKYNITHLTGVGKGISQSEIRRQFGFLHQKAYEIMLERYHCMEYCSDMGKLYQNADIALSRGGANALFELLEWEIPTLVIPLEKGSRGDQVENAKYLSEKKLCHTLSENHMFGFCESLESLASNRVAIAENIRRAKAESVFDGRENIVKLILSH